MRRPQMEPITPKQVVPVILLTRSLTLALLVTVLSAIPSFAESDKLYDYLVRLATVVNHCGHERFKQALPLLDSLVAELEKLDRNKSIPPLVSPSGLHAVTPIITCPRKCGSINHRLYLEALSLRGQCRRDLDNLSGALSDLKKVIQLCPDDALVRLSLTDVYIRQADYQKALVEVNKAIELDPKDPEGYFLRARIHEKLGNKSAQNQDLSDGNRTSMEDTQSQRKIDEKYFGTPDKPPQARMTPEIGAKLIAKNPRNTYWISRYADSLTRVRQYEDARKYATICIALEDDAVFGYASRANVEQQTTRFDLALKDAEMAVKIEPRDLDNLITRATTNIELGRYKEALKDLDLIVTRDPTWTDGYTYRASAYLAMNQPKKALIDAKKAVTLDPKYDIAYNNLGAAYSRLNDFEQARKAYETAVRLQKNFGFVTPFIRFNLGKCYWALNQKDKAKLEWDKVLLAEPLSPHRMFGRSATGAQLGVRDKEIKEALKTGRIPGGYFVEGERIKDSLLLLDRLYEVAPRRMETVYNRALAYICLNDTKTAIKELEKFRAGQSVWFDRAAVLLFLCRERNGEDAKAKTELQASLPSMKDKNLRAMAKFLFNEISETQLLSEVKSPSSSKKSPGITSSITSGAPAATPRTHDTKSGTESSAGRKNDTNYGSAPDITGRGIEHSAVNEFTIADESVIHSYLAYHFRTKKDVPRTKSNLEWTLLKGQRLTIEYVIALCELDRLCGKK